MKTWGVMDIETNTVYSDIDGEMMPSASWMYLGCYMTSAEVPTHFSCWDEFRAILDEEKPDIVFVHNLSYESEFMFRNGFVPTKIIANERHKPIAWTDENTGVQFRCSYMLTNKSLAKLGALIGLPKLDYEYEGIRTWKALTAEDFQYNARDCQIVVRVIKREIEAAGGITRLPLTKTGKVRAINKKADPGNVLAGTAYRAFPSEPLYDMLEEAFTGGLTGGNAELMGQRIKGTIYSYDKKSSYPGVMLGKDFPFMFRPIRKGKLAQRVFEESVTAGVHFVARFSVGHIRTRDLRFCILSRSKLRLDSGRDIITYNGKISSGYDIRFSADSVFWETLQKVYIMEDVKCEEIAVASSMRPLPVPLLKSVACLMAKKEATGKLYKGGDKSLAYQYQEDKENVNSEYGCNVQKFRDFEYSVDELGNWTCTLMPYKCPRHVMRVFAWGVWITSYARASLVDAILQAGIDNWVYSDTDSIKVLRPMKFKRYIPAEQLQYLKEILTAEEYKVIENAGTFCEEEPYQEFMHLGAKKYFFIQNGKFSFTVAGLPKAENSPKSFDDVKVGKTYTDVKLAKRYVNNKTEGTLYYKKEGNFIPYDGKIYDGGGVGLYPTSYTLGCTKLDSEYCYNNFGHNIPWDESDLSKEVDPDKAAYQIWKELKSNGRICKPAADTERR